MKKLLLILLSIVWISTQSYASSIEKIFDLKDAEYAELSTNKLNRYKISDNFLLGLKGQLDVNKDGYYLSYVSGILKDKVLRNWTYIEHLSTKNFSTLYTFTDTDGLKFIVRLTRNGAGHSYDKVYIEIDSLSYTREKVELKEFSIVCIGGKFQILINGKVLYKNTKRFSFLKSFSRKLTSGSPFVTDISLQEIVPSK